MNYRTNVLVENREAGNMNTSTTAVPNFIIENNNLSSGSVVLYIRLLRRGGHIRASLPAISKEIGMKKNRVFRYLHELENAGLLRLMHPEDDNTFLTITEAEIIRKGGAQ